ncbi:MAG: hypothetical protein EP329_14620 [Deltaproteobacteria bacterium]|nr:MAG: hypothetical protein EP329_14620 [Deltaproteobacteria bacterium]
MIKRAEIATYAALGALFVSGCGAARPAAEDTRVAERELPSADADAELAAAEDTAQPEPGPLSGCVEQTPLTWLELPEASGAARLDAAGDRVVVVADSGNRGQAVLLDLAAGTAVPAALPVDDGVGDDLEGLARALDGRIVGLTSAGWFREWRLDGAGFAVVRPAYRGSDAPGWSCEARQVNCGPNYEGLCLDPAPAEGGCVGFAASKANGVLVCVRAGADGFRIDPAVTIAVTEGNPSQPDLGPLSGCSYEPAPPHRLVVAGNAFTGSRLWEVVDHRSPASATVHELPYVGAPNQEAVLFVAGRSLASFGDLQSLEPRSPRATFRCE